ncbi:MAG: hypothetical protein K9G62_07890 [Alphaproteobacteria bacterium]|nr:hypothetical protein [Alphaproteobacteria bacterium]
MAGNGSFLPTATDGPALSRGIGIVSSIAPDPTNDQMYLGTTGGRVLAFDPSTTPDSVYVKMDVPGFSQAVAFANGYIWAGGSSGLAKVDPVTEVYTVISTTITPNALSCMGSTLYAVDGDAVYEINTLTGDATYLFTEDASIFGLTAKPPNSLIYTKGSSQTVVERSLTALPVELVAYDARETPPGNLITWKTTSESNSADFTVRHSTDFDRNWTTIATVPAAGNSTEPLSYSVTHTDFAAGNNYYELREKDLDGTEESLGVRTVFNAAGRTGIEIYPNPAQDRLNIKGLDPDLENAPYEIHDALGRTKRSGVVDLFNGAGGIDLGVLVPGLHTIQFGNPANGNTPVGAVQRFMVR